VQDKKNFQGKGKRPGLSVSLRIIQIIVSLVVVAS